MTFDSLTNRGEFFSHHYLDAIIGGDLGDIRSRWDDAEAHDKSTARSRLKSLPGAFFAARARVAEASDNARSVAVQGMHDLVLDALGFTPDRAEHDYTRATVDTLRATTAARVDTPTGLHLVAIEAGFADDVDDLFAAVDGHDPAGLLLAPVQRDSENQPVTAAPDAVGEFFALDEPPRYVLLLGGAVVLLAERAKWAEGRYLAVDLDAALERNDTKAKGELETIAALFSADVLVPDDGQTVLDELVESSHKHAVGVSKELRNGIRESIEILANEVIKQRLNTNRAVYDGPNRVDPAELTRQCLRYLYRLIVLLYAESRPELGVLPVNDEAYLAGYSLDRLRELTQVELDTDAAREGKHLDESLTRLFELVNDGYHANHAEQQIVFDSADPGDASYEEYLVFPGLDAALFDPRSTKLLDEVTLRNEALQRVLELLMLSPEGKSRKSRGERGFISYAQLGINQLGAVYEGLMAYSGFFATEDLYEVAEKGDSTDGTWVLPVRDADEYPDDVFVTRIDDHTGKAERVRHERGSFVFRLSGRDRQRSASYYTPEVLTRCVVKHALAELLGLDDYAPEHGSSGITNAVDLLNLTICEPALGSGAFLNEAINQLSAEYLRRRQTELGESLDPEQYQRELQKVKAHFALHQSYGVDLNGTAVELAEVSLWLNAMYPGLKAPWFGLQLRQGNSLIGCRRATWKTSQLADRPWAKTKKGDLQPPVDRPLTEDLDVDEIHHFLLPGDGWAAVAARKEAKELREPEVTALKEWRKQILKAPKKADAKRLIALTAGVEAMWALASERIRLTQKHLRRSIDVYGAPQVGDEGSRAQAEQMLSDPDSPLGRLRTLMDAWVGLWFWPLDTGVRPPSWGQWLQVAEDLIRPDQRHGLTGQLDLFDDLQSLLDAEENRQTGQPTVAELREQHPWLAIAVDAARREGAWHWELEYAPVFQHGGVDLQVGNPPWVRLDWQEDLTLAEHDPWWGVASKPSTGEKRERRTANLLAEETQREYLAEMASAEGVVDTLGSPVLRPLLTGIRTNLYMVFMDTTWRHLAAHGTVGLLHPESHFTDPKAGELRRATYGHLRRHFMFYNEFILFEDVDHHTEFSVNVYGQPGEIEFSQAASLFTPGTVDQSLEHDGSGPVPGIKTVDGDWDARPHRTRLLTITEEVLAGWAKLFDEPGTPAAEARLLRPVTTADLEALSVLADQPVRLADHDYHWTQGWNETNAKSDGTIQWETKIPDSWDEVILQGPHFTVATPFNKQPNENCKNNLDYSDWDLESLPERVIPRTNYQRACDRDTYDARSVHWNGDPSSQSWRLIWRAMTQAGLERSLHSCLLQPGPAHVGGAFSLTLERATLLVQAAGLWASLPVDYLVKVSGVSNVKEFLVSRFPQPEVGTSEVELAMACRVLRLNCLTADYSELWEEVFDPSWKEDRWTDPDLTGVQLGDVTPEWTMDTPLRCDQDRWQALVELDALAALVLGLTAEQLCAMYRTQFAVLRKYEYKMVFDAEGRKICGYHQSAGYRQSQLQDQAKAGDLPTEWMNLWNLYEQYESDPEIVDWQDHYTTPFTRADREAAMTRAYEEFQRRLDEGEIR